MWELFLRSGFNYDRNAASDESGLDCSHDADGVVTPSMTKQAFAEECDINTIVRRFGLTGQFPTNLKMPMYGDYEGVTDFHTAMNAVASAHEAFDSMPADIRARFHNDPQQFLEFCADDKNRDDARRMGLLVPEAVADLAAVPPQVSSVPAVAVEKVPDAV